MTRISRTLLDRIVAEATKNPDLECCGLLLGDQDAIIAMLRAPNVAADPSRRFEIDPAVLLQAHREQRNGGPAIIGCYHSHPGGAPLPSAEDASQAEPNGSLWLIVGVPTCEPRAWRAVRGGAVHGRFVSVQLIVE